MRESPQSWPLPRGHFQGLSCWTVVAAVSLRGHGKQIFAWGGGKWKYKGQLSTLVILVMTAETHYSLKCSDFWRVTPLLKEGRRKGRNQISILNSTKGKQSLLSASQLQQEAYLQASARTPFKALPTRPGAPLKLQVLNSNPSLLSCFSWCMLLSVVTGMSASKVGIDRKGKNKNFKYSTSSELQKGFFCQIFH